MWSGGGGRYHFVFPLDVERLQMVSQMARALHGCVPFEVAGAHGVTFRLEGQRGCNPAWMVLIGGF